MSESFIAHRPITPSHTEIKSTMCHDGDDATLRQAIGHCAVQHFKQGGNRYEG